MYTAFSYIAYSVEIPKGIQVPQERTKFRKRRLPSVERRHGIDFQRASEVARVVTFQALSRLTC